MKKCIYCQHENDDSLVTCQQCKKSLALAVIMQRLSVLLDKADQLEHYFPGTLANRDLQRAEWSRQLERTKDCIDIIGGMNIDPQDEQELCKDLATATNRLDFMRPFTVKVIGPGGSGKSTLEAALLNQDIFPSAFGKATTAVRTEVYLCEPGGPEQENMHVELLTRVEFEALKSDVQQRHAKAQDQKEKKDLERELKILTETGNACTKYLDFTQVTRPIVDFPRNEWFDKGKEFITERGTGDVEPTRVVKWVRFTIYADTQNLLPPGSILVDLPGAASVLHHQNILSKELDQIDAVILVVGSNRGGVDVSTQDIFREVSSCIEQKGMMPRIAAKMILVAKTHWDQAQEHKDGPANVRIGMEPLISNLPAKYKNYHHHGPDKDFFYPLRSRDAFIAALALKEKKLDARLSIDCTAYLRRVNLVYPQIRQMYHNRSLPAQFPDTNFSEVTPEQHQAILDFSGVPELTVDLQTFLTDARYEVQLEDSSDALKRVTNRLKDLCKKQVRAHGSNAQSIKDLQRELDRRERDLESTRKEQIEQLMEGMNAAWGDTLREFDEYVRSGDERFYKALLNAYQSAHTYVADHIQRGTFDHTATGSNRNKRKARGLSLEGDTFVLDSEMLIHELRSSLAVALEEELKGAADTLANLFLLAVAERERRGPLDIAAVTFNLREPSLKAVEEQYEDIKRSVEYKAYVICLGTSLNELVHKDHHLPRKDQMIVDLRGKVEELQDTPTQSRSELHQCMVNILDYIYRRVLPTKDAVARKEAVKAIEHCIVYQFQYQLDQFLACRVYDHARADVTKEGPFAIMVTELSQALRDLTTTSPTLQRKLDDLRDRPEADIQKIINLLKRIEDLEYAGSGKDSFLGQPFAPLKSHVLFKSLLYLLSLKWWASFTTSVLAKR